MLKFKASKYLASKQIIFQIYNREISNGKSVTEAISVAATGTTVPIAVVCHYLITDLNVEEAKQVLVKLLHFYKAELDV